MSNRFPVRTGVLTAALLLPLSVAGCSSAKHSSAMAGSESSAVPSSSAMASSSISASGSPSAMAPFGAACSAVPSSGPGSFNGMSTAPVATAASSNPVLKTLVAAVKAAGLVDALNSQKAITVLAPADSAFAKIPPATLNKLLADPKGPLTKILTYHVIPQRLSPDQLAGTHKTLNGADVTVAGSGEDLTVGPAKANVICGDVQTANATVYILDSVLMPPSS